MNNATRLTIFVLISGFGIMQGQNKFDTITADLKEQKIDFVDFNFTDLLGNFHCVSIPVAEASRAIKNGVSFDGSSIPGCSAIAESDMTLWPDLETFSICSACESIKSAHIICDIYRSINVPYEADARIILKDVIAQAHELGYEFLIGPELEFFLLNDHDSSLRPNDGNKYFDAASSNKHDERNKSLVSLLRNHGINVEKIHHEVAPGQHEISIKYANALKIADQIVLSKHLIKNFAQEHGLRATFMPKPFHDENGSSMHIHFSLLDIKKQSNAFYKKEDENLLSEVAQSFIAGVLRYAPELSALFNPSINSYKRLIPGHEAPIYCCWAQKNRSAMIRIPQIDPKQSSAARAEIRSPDGLSNPYLVIAGLLKAGLEGIKQNLKLGNAAEFNVYQQDVSTLIENGINLLPDSLEQSLSIFSTSTFIRDLLGQACIDQYMKLKKAELSLFRKNITSWELEYYL